MDASIAPDERAALREFLVTRFNLSELKNLAFDLGVDYESLDHDTEADFCRELILYFERRNNLACLLYQVLRQRVDQFIKDLLTRLPGCAPRGKVEIKLEVIVKDLAIDKATLQRAIAQAVQLPAEEVAIIATAAGSIVVLAAMPGASAEWLAQSGIQALADGALRVVSIRLWGQLPPVVQRAWRTRVTGAPIPPGMAGVGGLGLSPLVIILVILIGAAVVISIGGGVAVATAPQLTIQNQCRTTVQLPFVGAIAPGRDRTMRVPPGRYVVRYDGRELSAQAPVVGQVGPFTVGQIDVRVEGAPLQRGRPVNLTFSMGGRYEVVLCPGASR